MRPKRLVLALLLAVALAPGNMWYEPEPPRKFEPLSSFQPLEVEQAVSGRFQLVSAWRMTGDRLQFGGFSALVSLDELRFLAGTDSGRKLVFERPDRSELPGLLSKFGENQSAAKLGRDLESLTIDPDEGTVWAGYEYRSSILRLDKDFAPDDEVRPAAMRDWGENSGPEAMVRFADGRFLVIEEGATEWGGDLHHALLFAGDPIESEEPEQLLVRLPLGYRPTGATLVEGARALVLLRRVEWGLKPVFESALAEIDIDRREEDGAISTRLLTEFGDAIPQDNYEGLTITRDADGTHVWLISDDNFMSFQRTLLLKLKWQAREKARE